MLIKRIQEIAPKKTDRNGLGSLPSTIRLKTLASDSMKINLALLFFFTNGHWITIVAKTRKN